MRVNKTNFHMKGFALRTRFETEAKCNSEIAYFNSISAFKFGLPADFLGK